MLDKRRTGHRASSRRARWISCAQIAFAVDRGRDAPRLLLEAAGRLERLDPALARETYLDAPVRRDLRRPPRPAPPTSWRSPRARGRAGTPRRLADLLLDGLAAVVTEGHAAAAPRLRRALDRFSRRCAAQGGVARSVPQAAQAALLLWDFEAWRSISERRLQSARDDGALAQLPLALVTSASVHLWAGELNAAAALVEEMETVADATASRGPSYGAVTLGAWRGRDTDAEAIERDAARGEGLSETIAQRAAAVLYNGLGRYEEAMAAAELAAEDPPGCPRGP